MTDAEPCRSLISELTMYNSWVALQIGNPKPNCEKEGEG